MTGGHASLENPRPHAEGSAGRGGSPLTCLHGSRRVSAEGGGRRLLVPAARLAGHQEDRADHPREMDRAGASEVFLPAVVPAELWQESGRWDKYGAQLLRFKDRKGGAFVIGPTHEEV